MLFHDLDMCLCKNVANNTCFFHSLSLFQEGEEGAPVSAFLALVHECKGWLQTLFFFYYFALVFSLRRRVWLAQSMSTDCPNEKKNEGNWMLDQSPTQKGFSHYQKRSRRLDPPNRQPAWSHQPAGYELGLVLREKRERKKKKKIKK